MGKLSSHQERSGYGWALKAKFNLEMKLFSLSLLRAKIKKKFPPNIKFFQRLVFSKRMNDKVGLDEAI